MDLFLAILTIYSLDMKDYWESVHYSLKEWPIPKERKTRFQTAMSYLKITLVLLLLLLLVYILLVSFEL
jgi:hypothetical protein